MEPTDVIAATVLNMTAAFHRGDIPGILATYEHGAVVVGEPGKPLGGEAALRQMFAGFIALKPCFTYSGHELVQAGDLALHIAPWRMTAVGPEGAPIQQTGLSLAVLRRQADGRWLMVIDHPHGDALLRNADQPNSSEASAQP
jgi:uncharacterized protein (TIGR02246 family)